MTTLRNWLIALAFFAPALAACDGVTGPAITEEWRTKATEELLRDKVVRLNERLIKDHIAGLDDAQARLFMEATLNEFAQCIAFRNAQAEASRYKDVDDATHYDAQRRNIERHRMLFLAASKRVFDGKKLFDSLIAKANADTANHMHTIQPDRISLQKNHTDMGAEEYAQWQARCDQLEATLKSEIEQQAHLRLTPIEIEVRAHKLAANQN